METWRKGILKRLETTLIVFELILSVIFISIGHFINNAYIRGVGVGLMIAWTTSALAHWRAGMLTKNKK